MPLTEQIIPLEYQAQQKSNWCWAACASMISTYYSTSALGNVTALSQAELAGKVLGGSDRNEQATLHEVKGHLKKWCKLPMELVEGPLSFEECCTAINCNRLIAVRVVSDGGHNIVVHGFGQVDNKPALRIAEPAKSKGGSGWAFYSVIAARWHSCLILDASSTLALD